MSVSALTRISEQLGILTIAGGSGVNYTVSPFSDTSFKDTFFILSANIVWTVALVISLLTASVGLLIKIWIDGFMAYTQLHPRRQVISRSYSHAIMSTRRVFSFTLTARRWLCVAVFLFLLGLEAYMLLQNQTVGFIAAAGALLCMGYLFITGITMPALFYNHYSIGEGILHIYRSPKYRSRDILSSKEEIRKNANVDLVILTYVRSTLPYGQIDQAILEIIKHPPCNAVDFPSETIYMSILSSPGGNLVTYDMFRFIMWSLSSSRVAGREVDMKNSSIFLNMYLNVNSTLRFMVIQSFNVKYQVLEYLVPELLDLVRNGPIAAAFAILVMRSVTSYTLIKYPDRWGRLFDLVKFKTGGM